MEGEHCDHRKAAKTVESRPMWSRPRSHRTSHIVHDTARTSHDAPSTAIGPCDKMIPMVQPVDFVVNVYERTYRDVLTPGWFHRTKQPLSFPFARTVVLINNTKDPDDARRRARGLIATGEIDEAHFVSDHLDAALSRVGLRQADLEPVPHFSDCAFVALALAGNPWLVYWDADLVQIRGGDWVTPSLKLLENDPHIAVANPAWHHHLPQAEAFTTSADFALGYGFSDQVFLCRRDTFLSQRWSGPMMPASYRYPLAPVAPVFEQRVDSWMRRTQKLRATYLLAQVEHKAPQGGNYPRQWPLSTRMKHRVQKRVLQLGSQMAPRDPRLTPHPKPPVGNTHTEPLE